MRHPSAKLPPMLNEQHFAVPPDTEVNGRPRSAEFVDKQHNRRNLVSERVRPATKCC
jgi:hypothetical protein